VHEIDALRIDTLPTAWTRPPEPSVMSTVFTFD
jgi:hypothetical protein